jgi:hypothetical protein
MGLLDLPYQKTANRAGVPEVRSVLTHILETDLDEDGQLLAADLNQLSEDDMLEIMRVYVGPCMDEITRMLYARFHPDFDIENLRK